MSLRLLFVLLLMVGGFAAQAQPCRNVSITTQQQMDDFAALGCSGIDGDLGVVGYSPSNPGGVRNMGALSSVTSVTGNVNISLGDMTNIQGLGNLRTVGGALTISGCNALTNVDANAFSSLISVQSLAIRDNAGLTLISGFPLLRTVQAIEIMRNRALLGIPGLNAVPTVGSLVIGQCRSLQTISGFNGLTTVSLAHTLPGAGTQLTIYRNGSLQQITGFAALAQAEFLNITNNGALTSLAGFNALRSINSLQITQDSSLASISGFNGGLVATGNASLSIANNPALRSITGFAGVNAVSAAITVNKTLPDVRGFRNSQLGSLSISSNENLTAVSGFAQAAVTQSIRISDNIRLDSISAFGGPNAPTFILVEDNAALRYIAGAFAYQSYASLGTLRLVRNPALAACAQPWICQYLARGGNATISSNAPACTEAAIRQTCTTLAVRPAAAQKPAPCPNPTADVLQLPDRGAYRVSDLAGRVLLTGTGTRVSLAGLPAGLYLVHTGPDLQDCFRIAKL